MATKRYLVTRNLDVDGVLWNKSFHVSAKPGDELDLDRDVAEFINQGEPGALMEMDSRTEARAD